MFIDINTKQQWKKILHGSFVNSLNLNDLQELSSGEKKISVVALDHYWSKHVQNRKCINQ